jgi:hypothetical protein
MFSDDRLSSHNVAVYLRERFYRRFRFAYLDTVNITKIKQRWKEREARGGVSLFTRMTKRDKSRTKRKGF